MDVLVASRNKDKIFEIKGVLRKHNVVGMEEMGIFVEIEEDRETYEGNALKKAYTVLECLIERGVKDFVILADDSGLEIEELPGQLGLYSARYGGEEGESRDSVNNQKLLEEMKGKENRKGKYVTTMVLMDETGSYQTAEGEMSIEVGSEERHGSGFAYDRVCKYEGEYISEMLQGVKDSVSARGKALEEVRKLLRWREVGVDAEYPKRREAVFLLLYGRVGVDTGKEGKLQQYVVKVLKRYDGYEGFIGGLVDEGETREEALVREMKEEVGIGRGDIGNPILLPFCRHIRYDGDLGVTAYAVEVTEEVMNNVDKCILNAPHKYYEVLGSSVIPLGGEWGKKVVSRTKFIGSAKREFNLLQQRIGMRRTYVRYTESV